MTAQCLISFGSNLGDRDALISDAARKIAASPLVQEMKASRLFETPPVGGPDGQEPFLNAVAAFETNAAARDILNLLQLVETELGRQRRRRWDARSIDLDVVLHGQLVGGGTGLIVPHPRYTARQFVLQPACDVAPHYQDPRFGWTLRRLATHLSEGVPSLALVGGDDSTRKAICDSLKNDHGIRTFAAGEISAPMAVVGNAPAAVRKSHAADDSVDSPASQRGEPIVVDQDEAWVAAYLPELPSLESDQCGLPTVPRLVARMERATPETDWPAPHQMWPAGWRWPEYRLEVDDLAWAAGEIASALESMRCPVEPVSADGTWWQQ